MSFDDQNHIKLEFLKILKQLKIFEFDKFMQWMQKIVQDYQRIGHNIIENLDNEFNSIDQNNLLSTSVIGAVSSASNSCVSSLSSASSNGLKLPSDTCNGVNEMNSNVKLMNDLAVASNLAASQSPNNFYKSPYSSSNKSKISQHHMNVLESIFREKQYLNRYEREQLSVLLQLTSVQIKSWFKNRRYRQKKINRQFAPAPTQQDPECSANNDNIDDEIQNDVEYKSDCEDINSGDGDADANVDADAHGDTDANGDADTGDEQLVIEDRNEVYSEDECANQQIKIENLDENEDKNENSKDISNMSIPNNYTYHRAKQSPESSPIADGSLNTTNEHSTPINLINIAKNINSPSLLAAAAALAAVTNNVPSHLQSSHQQIYYSINPLRFSKALDDELERIFVRQKYITNTERDYLADKFQIDRTQITNWFQNKRRKIKRLERNLNLSRLKSENTVQLALNALNTAAN